MNPCSVAATVVTTNGTPSAACAAISPVYVFASPSGAKNRYMPTPTTTTGTIIGESSTAISSPLPRNSAFVSPIAASVPSTVATSVADGATMKLFFAAMRHSSDAIRFSYQRVENPGIGYTRNVLDENDSGTIASTGRIRYSSVSTTSTRNATNHARSTSDMCGANSGLASFMVPSPSLSARAQPRLTLVRVKRPYTAYSTSVAASSSPPSAHAIPQLIVTFVKYAT
ncbi:hypothetical protein FEP81_05694 [Burkholderia multivorans]|nr:hypothetical protein [Burkholderia multivorans]MDR8857670.1 hypothetical protein [Burkholderia multivorans]